MWLLSTDRAELHHVPSAVDVKEGYAILSHVWGVDEQTFQEIQAFRDIYAAAGGTSPRDLVSAKIRNCCLVAERHGYRWIWIDTCCIDKSSSSELSEAINSMFQWYAQAEVCYTYLADVHHDYNLRATDSMFRRSRWHTRGWTLQELVAPALVIFLSSNWEVLGTKAELAELLEEITRIPATVLKMEEALSEISVARRMSWAEKRNTTRPEDQAYCLLGIFDINIPTLYGEGKRAFRRLQEEIMGKLIDTSLFVWGKYLVFDGLTYEPVADGVQGACDQPYLLASSPSDFSGDVYFDPPRANLFLSRPKLRNLIHLPSNLRSKAKTGIPTFSTTPYGVHARLPVFEVFGYTVAVLFCREEGQYLDLLLTPSFDAPDPSRLLYYAGAVAFGHSVRIVTLGDRLDRLRFNGRRVTPSWRELYISHRPPLGNAPSSHTLLNRSLSTPFRIPQRVMRALSQDGVDLVSVSNMELPWTGNPPVTLTFESGTGGFMLHLGRCTSLSISAREGALRSGRLGPHWACLQYFDVRALPLPLPDHACHVDHVSEWTNSTRSTEWPNSLRHFEANTDLNWLPNSSVTLSSSPCPLNRRETLVVNISVDLRSVGPHQGVNSRT